MNSNHMMYLLKQVFEMNKKIQIELKNYLSKLRLTTVLKEYPCFVEQAQSESLCYEEFLLSLLEAEYEARKTRRIIRSLRESQLPLEKNIQSFDLSRIPRKVNQQFKTLLRGEFIRNNENVLIFGNPGSGKTHLMCALAQELISQDKKIYFSTCALLLQQLLIAKKELRLPNFLKKLSKYDALIIDDIGYVQQEKEEMEVLFTLLAQRYEQGSVMITSNLPFSKWENIFKDPMMTAAAVDRIVHHSVILELNVESYRMKTAKNRKIKEGN